MDFKIVFFIFLFFLSCNSNTNEIRNTSPESESFEEKNDQEIIRELIIDSSFDFGKIKKDEVKVMVDNLLNKVMLVKIYVDTDGTGTLGWLNVDFNKNRIFDISDPENPISLTFNKELFQDLKEVYVPKDEVGKFKNQEDDEVIFCSEVENDNVFDNPLIEKCECNTNDIVTCYSSFYQKQGQEYKEYLLEEIDNELSDTLFLNQLDMVKAQYKLSADSLSINVSFEGGEDEFVFYRKGAKVFINSYSYPD